MPLKNSLLVFALAVLTIAVTYAGAQNPPAQPPPAVATACGRRAGATARRGSRTRGGARTARRVSRDAASAGRSGGHRARQARSTASTARRATASIARGGQLGGPNLLRSQLVLLDQNGEQILPVVQQRAPRARHAAVAASRRRHQGHRRIHPQPDRRVARTGRAARRRGAAAEHRGRRRRRGQAFFAAKCSSCHSATGDLQGIATRVPDPQAAAELCGSPAAPLAAGGGRGGAAAGQVTRRERPSPRPSAARRRERRGPTLRIDDFLVSLAAGGRHRSAASAATATSEGRDARSARAVTARFSRVYTDKDMHDVTAYLVP